MADLDDEQPGQRVEIASKTNESRRSGYVLSATSTACRACSWCRSDTAVRSSPRSPPSRRKSSRSSHCGRMPPARDRARRTTRALRTRRPQPGLLHHRRRRGRRDGLEAGEAVLQADRQTRQVQGDLAARSLTTAPLTARLPSPVCRRSRRHSSRSSLAAFRVPNTNFYRAPAPHDIDVKAFGQWAANRIAEAIEFEGPDTVAAVFLEPVQNAGGCFPPPPGYFERVREICDEYDVLLVSDEVICAFGRIGRCSPATTSATCQTSSPARRA